VAAPRFLDGVVSLVDSVRASSEPISGVIRRLGEPVQFEPELLQQLQGAGVVPGARVTAAAAGSYTGITVDGRDDGIELPNEVAVHIFIGV
jgi:DtxR family Mn-dependent transcriptional regulator